MSGCKDCRSSRTCARCLLGETELTVDAHDWWWQMVGPGTRLLFEKTGRVVEIVATQPEERKLVVRTV